MKRLCYHYVSIVAVLLLFCAVPMLVKAAPEAPRGYVVVLKTDFSSTAISNAPSYGQWMGYLSGGEFGYSWTKPAAWSGRDGARHQFRVQYLVDSESDLTKFQEASVFDMGGKQGKVLKFANKKSDKTSNPKSRCQLYVTNLEDRNHWFYRFKFYFPDSLRKDLEKGATHWLNFTEFHDNGDDHRLSVHLLRDKGKWKIHAQCRNDTKGTYEWQQWANQEFVGWDEWHELSVQMEANNNSPTGGLLKVWYDDDLIINETSVRTGFPVENLCVCKLYFGRPTQAQSPVAIAYFDDIVVYQPANKSPKTEE